MIRTVILTALALVCVASIAEARPQRFHPDCNVTMPCVGAPPAWGYTAQPARTKREVRLARHGAELERKLPIGRAIYSEGWGGITRPARYIGGRLVCAINVNAALAERGIRGTGSALAKSFLHWGQSTAPTPGAVAVYNRKGGGHVAIVSRVEGGRVYVWNPSSRGKGWREVEYRRRAIDYRAAL